MKNILRLSLSVLFIIIPFTITAQKENAEFTVNLSPANLQYNPIYSYTTSEAQLYTALFEGLVSYDPYNLNPVPAIAEKWDISEDGKTYTFYLRDTVYSNGDQVTAKHFRDSWLELLHPQNDAAYSFLFDIIAGAKNYRTGKTSRASSVGIKVLSDTVLEVVLEKSASHFMKILCHHSFSAVHPENLYLKQLTQPDKVIGNGPFIIDEYSSSELSLKKNPRYWDKDNVYYDIVKINYNDDDKRVTELFNKGQIEWVAQSWDLREVQFADAIKINPMFATTYFFLVSREKPFNNPKVRRGLALIMPWEKIRDHEKFFTPADTLVPPIPLYPEVEGLKQDVQAGKKLLAEAGYPEGRGLKDLVFKIPPDPVNRETTELIASALKEHLEVTTQLKVVSFDSYFEALNEDDYTFGTLTWIGDFADPLTFLQMWTSDSNLNDANFRDQEFDTLIEDSMSGDTKDRYENLAKAEEILIETGVVLPISHTPAVNLIDTSRIDGWYPNPLDIHPFKYLKPKKREFDPSLAGLSMQERLVLLK
jgi:oligopeptide transport system substrate-binding protein